MQGCNRQVASQVLPFLRQLATHRDHAWLLQVLPASWCYVWNGSIQQNEMVAAPQAAAQDALAAALADVAIEGGSSDMADSIDDIEDD